MTQRPSLWRLMTEHDLPAVEKIAAQIHGIYPEDAAVFAERLVLYPAGSLIWEQEGMTAGYCISHPWYAKNPPPLNSLLQAIPSQPTTYYMHDVATLPQARGGLVAKLMPLMLERAKAHALPTISLVAVHDSVPLWQKYGFEVLEDKALATKLASYDAEAKFMTKNC